MATTFFSTTSALSSSSLLKLKHQPHMHMRDVRCSATRNGGERKAPLLLQVAVSGVTELLRLFSPKKQRDDSRIEEEMPAVRSVDDVVQILRSDYDRAYFLTGNFTSDIYAEDCLFEDPTIKFRGKDKYSQNLDFLVPFFDLPSLKLEKIEKGKDYEMNFVLAKWYLRTYLKFPWRPLIAIRGTTLYDLDKDFKIIKHAERWNISALQAVGQIFKIGSVEVDE